MAVARATTSWWRQSGKCWICPSNLQFTTLIYLEDHPRTRMWLVPRIYKPWVAIWKRLTKVINHLLDGMIQVVEAELAHLHNKDSGWTSKNQSDQSAILRIVATNPQSGMTFEAGSRSGPPKMISVPYKEHTVDGSEIRNNQLGCIKPRK